MPARKKPVEKGLANFKRYTTMKVPEYEKGVYKVYLPNQMTLDSRRIVEVPLGFGIEIPEGHFALIFPTQEIVRETGLRLMAGNLVDARGISELSVQVSAHHNRPVVAVEQGRHAFNLVILKGETVEALSND